MAEQIHVDKINCIQEKQANMNKAIILKTCTDFFISGINHLMKKFEYR